MTKQGRARLEKAIRYAGLKQHEFAEIVDVSRETVNRWLAGRRGMSAAKREQVAQYFGRSERYFR